jgi:hypothetical protein
MQPQEQDDAGTVLPVKAYSDHTHAVTCVAMACTDNVDFMASGSSRGEVILQSMSSGEVYFRKIVGHSGGDEDHHASGSSSVEAVAFTALHDGVVVQTHTTMLVLSTSSGQVMSQVTLSRPQHSLTTVYNLPKTFLWPKSPIRAELAPFILTADSSEVCLRHICDVSKPYVFFSLEGITGIITSAMVTPDGRNVVISLSSGALHLRALPSSKELLEHVCQEEVPALVE